MAGAGVEGVEHRRVAVDGVRLHLAEAGPTGGPPVVLLHGFPELWRGWRHQIPALAAAGFRVIAPDQRGYNLSDKPRRVRDYRLDRLADDVVGLIDALGHERVALAGHDWGGVVACWVAARQPERVARLALLNCAHPAVMRHALLTDRAQRRRSWYIFFFQLPWLPELWYRRRNFDIGVRSLRGTARRGVFADEEMELYREAWSRPGALRSMIHWYRAALRHRPARPRSGRIRAATLILWGERDRFLGRELAEATAARCDEVRIEYLPQATHWIQHEEPRRVNRELIEFFFHRGGLE